MIMKKLISIILGLAMSASCLSMAAGCTGNNGNEETTVTVTDMVNTEVEVKKNPQKVACVSRTTYDLLIAFGLGDVIDGAYYSLLDNEWAEVFYSESKNHYSYQYEESYETFYSRGVDLVLAPEAYIAEGLREHGITAITVCLYGKPSFDNYVYYFADLVKQLWGEREGVNEKVDLWKSKFVEAHTKIKTELNKHSDAQRKLYYVRGDKNKGIGYTDNGQSFTEYAYKFLGFDFVGNRFETNRPSAEEICKVNPDVFVFGGIYQNTLIETIKTTEPYANLDAVKNNQLFNIPIGLTMFEQISAFSPVFFYDQANKLYPDYFSFNVEQEIRDLSKTFFNVDLTDNEIYNMLHGLSREGNALA